MKRGEVVAYLSLIFILLVAFVGGIMESASIQMAKNYRRADMNRAMESVFAEYQKELLEEYHIFALDATYESGNYSEESVKKRLDYYGAQNIEQTVKRIEFLTDHGGKAFYEQVAAYMRHKIGAEELQGNTGVTDVWKQQEEQIDRYEKEGQASQEQLEGLLEENGGELPAKDNPIQHMEGLSKSPLLEIVMPKDRQVSEKTIDTSQVVSGRNLNQGHGDFSDVSGESGTVDNLLFGQYLLEHFSHAGEEDEGGPLDYELEYILSGKDSDKENLEGVVRRLLLFRFVPNYIHLQSSSAKKAEAEAVALTLCSIFAVPAITQAAAQVILLAWAYGESLVDIRALLDGNRVPLVKSEESWQLSLSNLLKLGETDDLNDGKDSGNGLRYEEYLRILLFLEEKNTAGMRAMDLIEETLKKEHGLKFFQMDCCISKLEMKSKCKLRRGITYQFLTYFGYN